MLRKKDLVMGLIHKVIEKYIFSVDFSKYTLNNILKFASSNTIFYRQFDFRDINNFPVLTKGIIRKEFEKLKSTDLNKRKWWINTSGGSTGEPLKLIQDKEYLIATRYITYSQKKKLNYNFGDKIIKIWGDEREILKSKKSYKDIMLNKIKNLVFLNVFNMSEKKIKEFVFFIKNNPPKLIVAYAQPIFEIAKFINRNNIYIEGIGAIITSAGTLYDFMREEIEKAFKTKVYNRYGSREVGNIACEEPKKEGLIVSNGVYLEIMDYNGKIKKNGTGEIIVTSLINYAMPLIRYKIGDIGTLQTLENGKQILTNLQGRNVCIFKTRDGKLIDGGYFTSLVFNKFWIKKFQFIQKKYDLIEVKIVSDTKNKEDLESIEEGIKKVMGNDCRVKFYFEKDIKPLKSGKFIYTISEI